MARRKNHRAKERLRRRQERSKQDFVIANTVDERTLRTAARHQIARDSAVRLWIYPWIIAPTGPSRRSNPKASLLDIPAEIRQTILYEAFGMTELNKMVEHVENKGKRAAAQTKAREHRLRLRRERVLGMTISQFESDSITMLYRRIADFCCVSYVLRTDMEYVGELWKKDLEKSLGWQFTALLKLPKDPIMATTPIPKRRKGKGLKVKGRGKHAGRPPKCWKCEDRHFDGDSVCPMARYDPERWQQLTKKKRGWRDVMQPCSLFKATKIVFADD